MLALLPGDRSVKVVDIRPKRGTWLCKVFGWTNLPSCGVLTELHDALKSTRKKRTRALWKGNQAYPSITVEVRGRTLELINDMSSLKLVLDIEHADLQWVVDQIHHDLHTTTDTDTTHGPHSLHDETTQHQLHDAPEATWAVVIL